MLRAARERSGRPILAQAAMVAATAQAHGVTLATRDRDLLGCGVPVVDAWVGRRGRLDAAVGPTTSRSWHSSGARLGVIRDCSRGPAPFPAGAGQFPGRLSPRLGTGLGLGVWGVLALAANLQMPLWGDDWCRLGKSGLGEILAATQHEYMTWSGRVGPIVLTYLFLGPIRTLRFPLFEIANAFVFVILLHGLVATALALLRRGEHAPPPSSAAEHLFLSLTAGLLLWWTPSSIAETALWKTGAIGYLWPAAFVLLLAPTVVSMTYGRKIGTGRLALMTLPLGFFATFLEPLSTTVAVGLAAACWQAWRRRHGSARQILILCIAQGLGTLVLLAAPGNLARAASLPQPGAGQWLTSWRWFVRSVFDDVTVVAMLVVGGVWLCTALPWIAGAPTPMRERIDRLARAAAPFAGFFLLYVAPLLLLPSPAIVHRLGFPLSIALCGIMVVMLADAVAGKDRARGPRSPYALFGAGLASVLVAFSAVIVARDLDRSAAVQRHWPEVPRGSPSATVADTELLLSMAHTEGRPWLARKTRFFLALSPDPEFWANRCYAKAIGVRSVRGY